MDERIQRHAEILVEHCTEVTPDDDVLIRAPTVADDLVVALHERLGDVGASVMVTPLDSRASRAYLRAVDVEDVRTSEHELAAMEESDVVILVGGSTNAAETSDVDRETGATAGRARQPILEERLDKRWVITRHPTAADAQQARMSTEAWRDYVYDAVTKDWDEQRRFQEQMVDVLEPASAIRIVTGTGTDLRMSIDGMGTVNDYGKENMPGGEVATSPVVDSVEGTLYADFPFHEGGREVEGARLVFEDGVVVDWDAEKNASALESLLDTDEGARRLGELGIGMNRDVERYTHTMLFDEKMGDTVHVALGAAMEECVPVDREYNESARHVDVLLDVSEDSHVEVDGRVVQRDGVFCFEDGFDE